MTPLVIPIRKVTVSQSSYAFAWWPHPLCSTIHNYLTEELLPLMFHYWLGGMRGSKCLRVLRVIDRGCEGKDLALCWNAEVQMLCVHALDTCLCCFCMSEPCIRTYKQTRIGTVHIISQLFLLSKWAALGGWKVQRVQTVHFLFW